jgi:hypothetical protein
MSGPRLQGLVKGCRKSVREAARDALDDLRSFGCIRVCSWICSFLCTGTVLAALLTLLDNGTSDTSSLYYDFPCLPSGDFIIPGDPYRPLAKLDFFQIDYGFGALDFNYAKVIDILWDIVRMTLRRSAP